ncbi:cupin domain-containing protein [Acidisoma sp.]|uniref:cupin domain-containing protein n=1 Tax=Acidisoma sp. TaxID=1872115 RepID=UPI003AFFA916
MSLPDNLAWPTDASVAAALPELAGTGATLRQVRAPAGLVAARHSHPFEQFLYVVAGGGVLERESGRVLLAPGVVIHLATDDWHSAVFETDTFLLEVNLAATPSVGV